LPDPPEPPEAVTEGEADAPPGDDEGAADCDPTARGDFDAAGVPEGAADDAVAPVDPAVVAGVGDDPVDAVQPAAAATAATAVTMPATRSGSEPKPAITNHPSSDRSSHY